MAFVSSTLLLFVILNPFALSVYLIELFHDRTLPECTRIVGRAALISGSVFAFFACTGDAVFRVVLQVRFAAFQVFGGTLFFVIALRFMLGGTNTIANLRGEAGYVAGAIAMPFMIGPGTVSAATLAGLKLGPVLGTACVVTALAAAAIALIGFKIVFDHVKRSNSKLVERYVEVASRVSAMVIGSVAVEMTLSGLEAWLDAQP